MHNCIFGVSPPVYQDPIEFTAFNAYALRQTELDECAEILTRAALGEGRGTLNIENLTEDELKYIESRVNELLPF